MMFTIKYKGIYIHGYCDRQLCRVDLGGFFMDVKSLHSAKLLVSKWLTKCHGVSK